MTKKWFEFVQLLVCRTWPHLCGSAIYPRKVIATSKQVYSHHLFCWAANGCQGTALGTLRTKEHLCRHGPTYILQHKILLDHSKYVGEALLGTRWWALVAGAPHCTVSRLAS